MMTEQLNSYVSKLENICVENDNISPRLFEEYGVN